jgi:hypothetical protein
VKRCVTCQTDKPLTDFPSPGALACNFCTPVTELLGKIMLGSSHEAEPTATPVADWLREARKHDTLGARLIKAAAEQATRPLIDAVQEATFTEPKSLVFIEKKYDLRMLLRKAHRFMLDDETSQMIADFSVAIVPDLESARRLALPPFPVTWIEVNNTKRLERSRELNVVHTPIKVGDDERFGEPVDRCGWLIHPAAAHGYYATYFCEIPTPFALPMSYWWHTDEPDSLPMDVSRDDAPYIKAMQKLCFGVTPNVMPSDAYTYPSELHVPILDFRKNQMTKDVYDIMAEMAGELRHIWGLLIALGAGQLGVEAQMSDHPVSNGPAPIMKNGKPLLPLEHKMLHLHLAKRVTPEKVVLRAVSHHKNREHEVRLHWRTYRNEDGSVKKRIPIKEHKRGDARLGVITKSYRLER